MSNELFAPQSHFSASGLKTAAQRGDEPWRRLLVGQSPAMDQVADIIRLVGPRRCTVLITGETGTGKEVAAQAVHAAGPRGQRQMVAVNCSALPENLLEAELFGYVRGAFTGAAQNRAGRFEQAHNSTLFLDEIGELPLALQAKLLRVLQERELQRLGSSQTIQVDVRVIAASNRDLGELVRQGLFREDLYYRLNVVTIEMPPLRQRSCDVPLLAVHFVEKICRAEDIPVKKIAPEALSQLSANVWPGNVRELANAIEKAVALSGWREELSGADFPAPPRPRLVPPTSPQSQVALPDQGLNFAETVADFERNLLDQALQRAKGNKKLAADLLRLKRTTLSAKLRSLGQDLCA